MVAVTAAIIKQDNAILIAQRKAADTAIDSVYFSFVTATTLGFGDFVPLNALGKILVILQTLTSIAFVGVFFSYVLTRIGHDSQE